MKQIRLAALFALLSGARLLLPERAANAQSVGSALAMPSMDSYAKAHLALTSLRSKVQAELADPKAKKPEIQTALREKLQADTQRVLSENGLSAAEFARVTRLVSSNDTVRKTFERAVERLSAGKGGE